MLPYSRKPCLNRQTPVPLWVLGCHLLTYPVQFDCKDKAFKIPEQNAQPSSGNELQCSWGLFPGPHLKMSFLPPVEFIQTPYHIRKPDMWSIHYTSVLRVRDTAAFTMLWRKKWQQRRGTWGARECTTSEDPNEDLKFSLSWFRLCLPHRVLVKFACVGHSFIKRIIMTKFSKCLKPKWLFPTNQFLLHVAHSHYHPLFSQLGNYIILPSFLWTRAIQFSLMFLLPLFPLVITFCIPQLA